MNGQRLLLTLFSAVPLLLAAWIWNLSIDSDRAPQPDTETSGARPDTFATDLVHLRFSLQGQPIQRLTSERATSFNSGTEVELTRPTLLVVGADQTRWSASSNSGYLDRPGSKLDLLGNVVLNRLDTSSARLQTESLTWLPATSMAYSDQQVVVESPGNRLESRGISIDLDRSSFVLHSQVRGSHVLP